MTRKYFNPTSIELQPTLGGGFEIIKKLHRYTPLDYLKGYIYSKKEKNIWI